MSKYCPMCDAVTNCTDNCTECLKEAEAEKEDIYKSLGFKNPDFVENPYGIKIYLGTKGKDDWCIEVPKELCRLKTPRYPFGYNYVVYLESEEEVLRVAREFTTYAERSKRK